MGTVCFCAENIDVDSLFAKDISASGSINGMTIINEYEKEWISPKGKIYNGKFNHRSYD